MIYLGLENPEKERVIQDYCHEHGIRKVFVLYQKKFPLWVAFENTEHVEYEDIIRYKFFYRLLEEIDKDVLVVVNECLRTQNRNDLTYNCIRHYLNQTGHQLIFQYLPIIEDIQDFMTLFDFDTKSQWKREKFSGDLLKECKLEVRKVDIAFKKVTVPVSEETTQKYEKEKKKLFDGIGSKDPHTIPRNLYLISGRDKLHVLDSTQTYIGRNNRFKMQNIVTYKEEVYPVDYTVFEFCHNYIDFIDFVSISRQTEIPVLVTQTKTEEWYWERYQAWLKNLRDGYSNLQ